MPKHNTDGIGNCLQQPGQLRNQRYTLSEKRYHNLLNFIYRDNSCCRDKVNRAAGLRSAAMVFASPLRQFYRDMTTRGHLPGFSHLVNFTVTRYLHPSTGTVQKPCQRLTPTATSHTTGPLAQIIQYVTIKPSRHVYIIQLDKRCTALLPGSANARQASALPPSSINICYLFNNTAFYLDWAIARRIKTCANRKINGKYHDKFSTLA